VAIRFAERDNITAVVEAFTDFFEIDEVTTPQISESHSAVEDFYNFLVCSRLL